jgi:predicted dehydrogenase
MEHAQPVGVAIIGCGWAGTRHAHALSASGAQVRWCVDVDLARAQALCRDLSRIGMDASPTAQVAESLADPAVQAAVICLPHNLHAPVALQAAAEGKHILCEKPLAHSLEAADAMIAAADQAGVVLMVAENERFSPLYLRAKRLLDDGVIGKPALVQLNRECYLNRSFLEERRWFLDAEAAAGGMMMSGGVHSFATLLALMGDVASVQALRAPQRFLEMQGDDTSIALVRFASGVVGTVVESFCMKSLATAAGAEVHTLRIDGELGHLRVVDRQTLCVYSEAPEWGAEGDPVEHVLHVPEADTFGLEAAHFLSCLRSGSEPLTSGRAQRRPLEVVLAAYRSMETGQPVSLL